MDELRFKGNQSLVSSWVIQNVFRQKRPHQLINQLFHHLIIQKYVCPFMNINLSQDIAALHSTDISLRLTLRNLTSLLNSTSSQSISTYNNTLSIVSMLIKVLTNSFCPLELLLRFLTDQDLMRMGQTCRSLYHLIYSPLGYRLISSLRPVVKLVHKQEQMPIFTQTALDNLCSERSMVDMDDDDRLAVTLTMKTNLIATRQKIRQIQACNIEYDRRIRLLFEQIFYVSGMRDQTLKDIEQLKEEIEKLTQLRELGVNHVQELRKQQGKLIQDRTDKIQQLRSEKEKLDRQKELLIKKIKSQQKQREEGLVYAKEVQRIIAMLNKLTANRK